VFLSNGTTPNTTGAYQAFARNTAVWGKGYFSDDSKFFLRFPARGSHYLSKVIARTLIVILIGGFQFGPAACAQAPDPAYEPLSHAYEQLRARSYDDAITCFQKAIALAPKRASIHKDLAYTYLKVGESELARDEFKVAMEIDPADSQVAMEFAFLAYETKMQAEARRIFDRIRKTDNAVAEQAFHNIDDPLAAGIERWKKAIAMGGENFSAHFELATLAEQRDELAMAAEHFEKAWRLLPDRRSVLVDLGRVWKLMGRSEEATAALLAASRGGEPRAAEMARELLPERYPFVSEFEAALKLDPANIELRRELAYLLLGMERQPEAEREFQVIADADPTDMLAATQLGFLLNGRGATDAAMPLFERVLAGPDDDMANRVRAVLRMPQVLRTRPEPQPASIDAKVMAERSMKAGYMKDALKYLQVAHEADPGDFEVMLKLGWAYNVMHQDRLAIPWFDLARRSPDPQVSSEATKAWRNLESDARLFRTTAWIYPLFSTRWHDAFSYGQVKTEIRNKSFLRPYLSVRFIGDTRRTTDPGSPEPQYLSESSFIVGAGVRTVPWHNLTGWFEAGSAIGYLTGHMLPDYRGGASGQWRKMPEAGGWFADSSLDALFISRFDHDFLVYSQTRLGYQLGPHTQLYWNANITGDVKRQYWANFAETGPGIRLSADFLPRAMWISFNLLRGVYFTNTDNPRRPNFNDFRIGLWYAYTSH
jgi:tetratricopeptide (TPR) repeat protein